MAIFVIGDLHLSMDGKKTMEVFPGWEHYMQRLEENWRAAVLPEDLVVLLGDTSWAMSLQETLQDFAFLHTLPGKKLLLKGNHDYWWTTMAKMERFFAEQGWNDFAFLHNNCVMHDGVALCGTRSWMFDASAPQDEKVMARECGRLRMSLQAAGEAEKIVFLHYPPIYPNANAEEVVALLHEYGVKRCFYAHLHGGSIRYAVQGRVDGIEYRLVSADSLRFCPVKI